MEAEELILHLFPDARILGHRQLRWHCDCSRERFSDAMMTLRKEDIASMIEEDHGAEIVCQFCQRKYVFSEEDLREILEKRLHVEDRNRTS